MGEPQDEISLRELYLIFKGGLRWIVGVSLAVAVIAFLVMHFQAARYEATATVRVTPLKVDGQNQQTGQAQSLLDVNSVTQIGFDAYKTIALSHGVLAKTLQAVPSAPADLTTKQLAEDVSVSKVSGGGADPLIVSQSVTARDPELAASLANAWAKTSADAAQASVSQSVGKVRSSLDTQLTSLSSALDAAQAKWATFQKQDARSSLQAQLDALDTRTTTAQEKLDELDRNIATAKAQQSLLQAVVDARGQGKPAALDAQMQALANQGVLSQTLAQQLGDAIASVPGGPGLANQDLATLVARAQLQQQTSEQEGNVAERQTVQTQLDGFAKQASDLRGQLATQQQTAQQLQRQLDSATQAYDAVAQTAPLFDVADKLVPSMAGVFNSASVPEQPQSSRTAVVTAVAFVLAFFAMVLFVFLRAAVSAEPEAEPGDGQRPSGTGRGETSNEQSPRGKGPWEARPDEPSDPLQTSS
ncbi:MAG: Wzz/FepE/Etk N-terminal domain-containing protein [Deinococcales bacterium]